MVTGLVPCPLTTFILTYAIAQQKLAIGLAAVLAMLGGVIVTITGFAVTAVLARDHLMGLLKRTEGLRQGLGFWVELAGAAAVLVLGLAMLLDRLKWLGH